MNPYLVGGGILAGLLGTVLVVRKATAGTLSSSEQLNLPPVPQWMDFYAVFDAAHRAQYGIGIDRRWDKDVDSARAKQQLDAQYLNALNDYNEKYGTDVQPNTQYLGVTAQPNSYTPKPKKSGGVLSRLVGTITGTVAPVIQKVVQQQTTTGLNTLFR
jgi:hypothetical protein